MIGLYAARDIHPLAIHNGVLSAVGPCLILVDTDGVEWQLAWPSPGTDLSDDESTITVDGQTARVGEEVALGGGEALSAEWTSTDWVQAPPSECERDAMWIVHAVVPS